MGGKIEDYKTQNMKRVSYKQWKLVITKRIVFLDDLHRTLLVTHIQSRFHIGVVYIYTWEHS